MINVKDLIEIVNSFQNNRKFTFLNLFYIAVALVIFMLVDWYYLNPLTPFLIILLSLLIVIMVAIIIDFYYKQRSYSFSGEQIIQDWCFQGFLKAVNNGFQLNYSDGGCILKGRKWRDYKMSFEFKCNPPGGEKGFGLIIRAKDLENYIMLKIDDIISPHFKKKGLWLEILRPNGFKTENILDGELHKIELTVIKNKVNLLIDKKEYNYNIPTHIAAQESGIVKLLESEEKIEKELTLSTEINFNEAGSVGFRTWGYIGEDTESVLIKDLKIEKLKTKNSLLPLKLE